MITDRDVRSIAQSLPGVEEKSHVGRPDFRVGSKIFATLRRPDDCAVLKLSVADQSALVAMNPEIFAVNSWSHPGWTNVAMKRVTKRAFQNVVRAAWRNVAPKKVIASLNSNGSRTAGQRTAARNRAKKRRA
jgi:hypothetical protein